MKNNNINTNQKVELRWIQLTNEFRNALEKINNTKNNYFITGKAGTGKSTLLQYLNHTAKKMCVLLAPTGRAAINIEGQTLHSFFRLDWGVIQADDYKENYFNEATFEADVRGGEASAFPCFYRAGGRGERGIFLIIRDHEERKSIVL